MKRRSILIAIFGVILIYSGCEKSDAVNEPINKKLTSVILISDNAAIIDNMGVSIDLGTPDKTFTNNKTLLESLQDVIDKSKTHAQFQKRLKDLLSRLVTQGELTQDQADYILIQLIDANLP